MKERRKATSAAGPGSPGPGRKGRDQGRIVRSLTNMGSRTVWKCVRFFSVDVPGSPEKDLEIAQSCSDTCPSSSWDEGARTQGGDGLASPPRQKRRGTVSCTGHRNQLTVHRRLARKVKSHQNTRRKQGGENLMAWVSVTILQRSHQKY